MEFILVVLSCIADTSAVEELHRSRFAESDHAGVVNTSIRATRRMAGDVPIIPDAIAVGVPAKDDKPFLRHATGSL